MARPQRGLVLLTGAAGAVGRLLWPRLARAGQRLRLLDLADPIGAAAGDEAVEAVAASITDQAALRVACADVSAVVHLAAISGEADWASLVETNITGTHTVLEAARLAGVRRVVLASSHHVVGFHPVAEVLCQEMPANVVPRPDTYYGVSKAAMEALGSLYHDRFGMEILCLRIGTWCQEPTVARHLATWLSPDDGARLVEACLAVPNPGFRIVWGVSRNTRRWWSLAEGQAIGYQPADDAERYAPAIADVSTEWEALRRQGIGGGFCATPLGVPR